MSYNKFPWTNMHGFNLDWVIETVKSYVGKVDELEQELQEFDGKYETKENITSNRKLSETGDFTGTLDGEPVSQVLSDIEGNDEQIKYLIDQFQTGTTGLIIDGGIWDDGGAITRTFDGGVW